MNKGRHQLYFLFEPPITIIDSEMFLKRTGSSSRNLQFMVIYSALQKGLRGNFPELSLEMAKEFGEFPNAG